MPKAEDKATFRGLVEAAYSGDCELAHEVFEPRFVDRPMDR